MAVFDSFQTQAFRIVESIFGDAGVWNGEAITGLFREPTVKEKEYLGDAYNPSMCMFEYYADKWTGLKPLVDTGELVELTVRAVIYYVRSVHQKYDGKTFVAYLELKPTA